MSLPTFLPQSPDQYKKFLLELKELPPPVREGCLRILDKWDLYFLLRFTLSSSLMTADNGARSWWDHKWIFDRCREVQENPNQVHLWGRGHGKSTVITFGLTIQEILRNPEETIGIFSHTRPIAKGFLRKIKVELEQNDRLKRRHSNCLFLDPSRESPKWNEDEGITEKRKGNPAEATVEAWGLVDGQPISKHFGIRVYDDCVTRDSVNTPEMMLKTEEYWALSLNLGKDGGQERYAGTRYHFSDLYALMRDRGHMALSVHPAREPAMPTGTPVFQSEEYLDSQTKSMGPYVAACLPGEASVLMADFREKPISEVRVGDEVVGYIFPPKAKTAIAKSKVLEVASREDEVFEYTLASGRTVRCTKHHKWYTGRRGREVGGTDSHNAYAKIGTKRGFGENDAVSHLVSFYDPRPLNAPFDAKAAAWLSGFYDGEGSGGHSRIYFTQSEKYPPILSRLEESLDACGFDYNIYHIDRTKKNSKWLPVRHYNLLGGRPTQMRFLNIVDPAKKAPIIEKMFKNDARCFDGAKYNRDKIVAVRSLGVQKVYNIETETGNYVAYGYATKNSQLLLNPVADEAQGFKREWKQTYNTDPTEERRAKNVYILVDPAGAKSRRSDYTAIWVVGLGSDQNYYILDGVRDRLNLSDRVDTLFNLHALWRPLEVRYEEYALSADIEHLAYVQERRNYRFHITPVRGAVNKQSRIRRLVPLFEAKRVYFPENGIVKTDYKKATYDLVKVFFEEEFLSFPVGTHDDLLDSLARIAEPDLPLLWPQPGQFGRRDKNFDAWEDKIRRREPLTSWMGA